MIDRAFSFVGGSAGAWRVSSVEAVTGESLDPVARLQILAGFLPASQGSSWILRGVTSNERYVTRTEKATLEARQPQLGRAEATCAALIPVRKSASWWSLAQDERRTILEEHSHHIATGIEYLPAVARRLHHCRDLGEPFDFLTWFEFAPQDTSAFNHLVTRLRSSEEWRFVDREVDIRLERRGAA
jgi:chlorite dismutase